MEQLDISADTKEAPFKAIYMNQADNEQTTQQVKQIKLINKLKQTKTAQTLDQSMCVYVKDV